jgi:hypothetical protein
MCFLCVVFGRSYKVSWAQLRSCLVDRMTWARSYKIKSNWVPKYKQKSNWVPRMSSSSSGVAVGKIGRRMRLRQDDELLCWGGRDGRCLYPDVEVYCGVRQLAYGACRWPLLRYWGPAHMARREKVEDQSSVWASLLSLAEEAFSGEVGIAHVIEPG